VQLACSAVDRRSFCATPCRHLGEHTSRPGILPVQKFIDDVAHDSTSPSDIALAIPRSGGNPTSGRWTAA
jgi:hypothetical protein